MNELVYSLCAITSAACAVLLFRGYVKSQMRLLLWSTICFACLTVTNFLVYVDLVIYSDVDIFVFPGVALLTIRNSITFIGLSVLVYGMIKETV